MSMAGQARIPIPAAIRLTSDFHLLEPLVQKANFISLFLDFDGTVSPIVPTPAEATLDPEIRGILADLSLRPDFLVGMISGRSLEDLRERVGLPHVVYAGNHGLEIEAGKARYREPRAEALRRELRCLMLQLKLALSETEGMEIEDKGLTLAVHFRRVSEHLQDWVRNVTIGTVGRWNSFVWREGKKVLDICPKVNWHKGNAVRWIKSEILPDSALLIYVGDDTTDEDAFSEISEGVTIRVGDTAVTAARYTVADVPAVRQFLTWLSHAKPHEPIPDSERP